MLTRCVILRAVRRGFDRPILAWCLVRFGIVIARAVVLVALGWSVTAASADPTSELTVSKSCRELLQKRMLAEPGAQLVLGHFYVAQDSATAASVCGWSASSRYGAFGACSREAAKRGITAPCLLLVKDSAVVARSYADARTQAGADAWELTMAVDPLRCGQDPGSRLYWLEHGFCDIKVLGPEKARGIVIWNHGIMGTLAQHAAPPALALRLLRANGWDVIKINRHNLGEGGDSYRRAEQRTEEEITAQRERGYRRVVLAGQSFGGRVTLEVGASIELFAAVAFAPGMENTVGNTRTQAPTDQRLRRVKAERLAVVFPGNDELFGNVERGRSAAPILAARGGPYLLLDETAGLKGHGGGTGGNFALRYGRCLDDFLTAETVPAARFQCAAGGGWAVARELLPAVPPYVRVMTATDALPGGLWYGLVGESIVSFGVVDVGKPGVNILFTWAANGATRGGGVYEARIDNGEVKALLPNKAVLTIKRRDAHTLAVTWTPPTAESNFGISARRAEPLQGELVAAE